MTDWNREEIEAAYQHFVAAGDAQDWDAWADLHTQDGVWVEHHLGTFHGREEIRTGIKRAMATAPPMEFPVEWHVIEGNRVVYFPWQVFPDPAGKEKEQERGVVYRFGCVTILEYAGDGLWSYQEDVYNPLEGEAVVKRWLEAGGKLP